MTLIYLIGIATAVLLIFLWVEFVPSLPAGRAARYLRESELPAEPELPGWRRGLSWMGKPVARWMPGSLLRRARSDLYFAQLAGKWQGWSEIEFTSLRAALGVGAFILGLLAYNSPIPSLVAALLGWQIPATLIGSVARRAAPPFPGSASGIHPARGSPDGGRRVAGRGPAAHGSDGQPGGEVDAAGAADVAGQGDLYPTAEGSPGFWLAGSDQPGGAARVRPPGHCPAGTDGANGQPHRGRLRRRRRAARRTRRGGAGHPDGDLLLPALYRHHPGAHRLADPDHAVGAKMNDYGITLTHALSIAGSTFAFGFVSGWIWALFHFGGSSSHPHHPGKEE